MGSPFGIISLIAGICSLFFPFLRIFLPFLGFWTIAIPIVAIIFGIIGIANDDSKAPGIIGLIFGIIGLIIFFVVGFFRVLFQSLLGGLGI